MRGLDGKNVIVTGGAGAIGAAICRRFAGYGARVGVFDKNVEGARKLATEIKGFASGVDITDYDAVGKEIARFEKECGPTDVLVNNAGWDKFVNFVDTTPDLWEQVIAINLREDDELVRVIQTSGDDDVFMVSRNGMTIRFSEDDVRPMGRATAGVRGMRLRSAEDGVVSADVARDDAVLLFVSASGHGKRTPVGTFNRQGRGGQGVRGMRVTAERGAVVQEPVQLTQDFRSFDFLSPWEAMTTLPGDENDMVREMCALFCHSFSRNFLHVLQPT